MNNQPQTRGGFFTIAAWQRADDLTVKIYQTTQTFLPQERYGLNLPDATLAAYIRFLFIAKGSLTEVEYYIHLAQRLGYLSSESHTELNISMATSAIGARSFSNSCESQSLSFS